MTMTREAWLERAIEEFRKDLFAPHAVIPPVRVSIGFPGGGSARKLIGECWDKAATTDNVAQIFVSPILGSAIDHLEVLVHEVCHAVLGAKVGHRAPFKRLAHAVGLEGKMRSTHAGQKLKERLNTLSDSLGPFPHAAINLSTRKKQGTRMLKLECVCGFIARCSQGAIDNFGIPTCACGERLLVTGGEESA